jgi:hypothetical protein
MELRGKGKAPRERRLKRRKTVNNTKNAVMITIFSSMRQGKNHYTKTSIAKIGENLEKYHKIHVKRRWIFYCLAELLERKLLTRKSRYRNDDNGLITQIPSLLAFTVRGVRYLVAKRVRGAWQMLKSMLAWLKKGDDRWPGKKDVQDGSYWPEGTDERERLKGLLGIVGRKIE